jgi:hypothetical protein
MAVATKKTKAPVKQTKAVTLAAPPPPTQATMIVTVYDGTRQPIHGGEFLIRIFDGFQNQLFDDERPGPTTVFHVPFHDNLQDNYRVLASGDGYVGAGFTPIPVSPKVDANVDLMLLPKDSGFKFQRWADLKANDPVLAAFLSVGGSDADAKNHYEDLEENKAPALASLLNLGTAMKAIQLPSQTPLAYFKEIEWDASLARDRFFAYADQALINQVRQAAAQGEFAPEVSPGLFHPGATSSWKQIQFGEANVQLTFHEGDTKTIGGVSCVKVEPDIDYFQDLGAHTLLEVIPNAITHGLTDPKEVYVLRWIAGKHAGVPEFTPPYTIAT